MIQLCIFLYYLNGIHAAPIETEMVDMTYVLENDIPMYPGLKKFEMSVVINGSAGRINWLQSEEITTSTHMGTHMDAPSHFSKGGMTIDQIPASKLIAPAAVINIESRSAEDIDALVTVEDFLQWEEISGESLNGTVVLIKSGWGKKWNNRKEFLGNDGDPENLHYPGISEKAAQWLVDSRKVVGVGTEAVSIDKGSSMDFPAHNIVLGKGIFALENVANMEKIPISGATLHVMPMKIGRASGAPTRIIATFPKYVFDQENSEL